MLVSTVTGCAFISPLVGIPVGITSSAVRFKMSVICAGNKKQQSIIKETRKRIMINY